MLKHNREVLTIQYPTSQNIIKVGGEVEFIPHTTIFQKKKKNKILFTPLIHPLAIIFICN